jgi:hypothetical protein
MRALAALLAAGCGTAIDPAEVGPVDGYTSWTSFPPLSTDIPGHPASVRVIYVNEVGRSYPHGGRYPVGTVIVKEVFDRGSDGERGGLRYLAIMRKLGDDATLPTDGGWLFTDGRDGGETRLSLCWQTCHKAAPWDGAWFDYGE